MSNCYAIRSSSGWGKPSTRYPKSHSSCTSLRSSNTKKLGSTSATSWSCTRSSWWSTSQPPTPSFGAGTSSGSSRSTMITRNRPCSSWWRSTPSKKAGSWSRSWTTWSPQSTGRRIWTTRCWTRRTSSSRSLTSTIRSRGCWTTSSNWANRW